MSNIGVDIPVAGGGGSSDILLAAILATLTGSKRPITTVESLLDGSTPDNVQSMSILFDGDGGTLDGVDVEDGYIGNFTPNKGDDRVAAMDYTVPSAGALRVIIATVEL